MSVGVADANYDYKYSRSGIGQPDRGIKFSRTIFKRELDQVFNNIDRNNPPSIVAKIYDLAKKQLISIVSGNDINVEGIGTMQKAYEQGVFAGVRLSDLNNVDQNGIIGNMRTRVRTISKIRCDHLHKNVAGFTITALS
jgi:hypothetical protein